MNKIQNIRALAIKSLIMNILIEQETMKEKMELELNRHLDIVYCIVEMREYVIRFDNK